MNLKIKSQNISPVCWRSSRQGSRRGFCFGCFYLLITRGWKGKKWLKAGC